MKIKKDHLCVTYASLNCFFRFTVKPCFVKSDKLHNPIDCSYPETCCARYVSKMLLCLFLSSPMNSK